MDNTIQLYIDKNQEIKGYPITSPDRVIDENGVNIKQQLDTIPKIKYSISGLNLTIKDFNLIKAPTGSGKTYFCINKLSELTKKKGKILYLCPTTMLLNQLVTQNKENVRLYDPDFDDVEKYKFNIEKFYE